MSPLRRWLLSRVAPTSAAVLLPVIAFVGQQQAIERPRMGIPAVVRPGDVFEACLRVSGPRIAGRLIRAARLDDGTRSYPVEARIRGGFGRERRVECRAPAAAPPGRYALRFGPGTDALCRSNAVTIVSSFPETFRFVHMTDLGIADNDPAVAASFSRTVREINALRPDFVLFSGDATDCGRRAEYAALVGLLSRIEAPVICCPGNHDYRGLAGYLAQFGPTSHAVDFGSWRIVSLDSAHGRDRMTRSGMRRLERELAACATGGRRCLVQMHHPLFGPPAIGACRQRLADLLAGSHVAAVFSGHWHVSGVYDAQGRPRADGPMPADGATRFVGTTSVGQPPRAREGSQGAPCRGFRVVDVSGGSLAAMRTVMAGS